MTTQRNLNFMESLSDLHTISPRNDQFRKLKFNHELFRRIQGNFSLAFLKLKKIKSDFVFPAKVTQMGRLFKLILNEKAGLILVVEDFTNNLYNPFLELTENRKTRNTLGVFGVQQVNDQYHIEQMADDFKAY